MPSKPKRDRGFTLLEVIVAFALLSLVLGTALTAMSGGLKAQARTDAALEQLSLAQSTLARLGRELPLESATFTDPSTGMDVSVEVSPYQPAKAWRSISTAPWLVRIEITGDDGAFVLETLRRGRVP